MDLGNILSAGVTEWIKELFARVFGDNAALATVLISIVPIIELKGAIPFGMSTAFWGEHALSGGAALGCGILGGLIVAILLSFLLEPLVRWLKSTKLFKRLIERFEHSVREKAEKMESEGKAQSSPRKKTFYKMLGVFLFVAVPLPLTGVWTGHRDRGVFGAQILAEHSCRVCRQRGRGAVDLFRVHGVSRVHDALILSHHRHRADGRGV